MSTIFHTKPKFYIFKGRNALLLLCLLLIFLQSSCSEGPAPETTDRDSGFSQTYVQDPYTLHLRISKKKITIAEQLEIVLETAVPESTDVAFPTYSTSFGDFTPKDERVHPPRMTGSGNDIRVVHQVTYLLEPYLSGTYTIPAMTITYHDKKNETADTKLVTEEMEFFVTSLLSPDTERVEIKDIKPPLSLPPNRVQQVLVSGLVLLLVSFAISCFIYWKKMASRKIPTAVQLLPGEIALQELDRLLAEDLLARREIKLFHLRISDILRRYIENRFGMKAPERTTEEFLIELSQAKSTGNALLGSQKALLTDFLTQCDLVKFAKHEPTSAESEKSVVICREFIEKTRDIGARQKVQGKT